MYNLSYNLTLEKYKSLLVFLSLENSLLNLRLNYDHQILSMSDIESLTKEDLPNSAGIINSGNTICTFKYDITKQRLDLVITKKKFDIPYTSISQGLREIIENL